MDNSIRRLKDMQKLFSIEEKNGQIKVLPYDVNSNAPAVYAENEADALNVVYRIYRIQQRDFYRQDILDRAEDCEFDIDEEHVGYAIDRMENNFDCNLSYWDNVDGAMGNY